MLQRLAATSVLVGGAVAFVVFVSLPTLRLQADVIGPLMNAARFVPPPPGTDAVRTGRSFVNGQPFQYAIGHASLGVDRVLEHYEQKLGPVSGQPMSRAVRVQGRSGGVVVGAALGPVAMPNGLLSRPQFAEAPVRLNDIARIHVVTVYSETPGAVFLDFMAGDSVRLDSLLPVHGSDAPGADPQGIARPPGLQRLLTIEHGEGMAWSRTLIYRAPDGERATAMFRSAFTAAGWSENPAPELGPVRHLTNGSLESFVGGSGFGANAVVLVVTRLAEGQKR